MNVSHIQAALDADLTKNGYKAFLVLLMQTSGYGKTADAITTGRVSKDTGIRKDHTHKAIDSVIAAGLFDRVEHDKYEWEYIIPARHQWTFKTPEKTETNSLVPSMMRVPKNEIDLTPKAAPPAQELKKPDNMTDIDYAALLPALLMIPQAADVLALISNAVQNGSIRTTPARFGFALIKQVNNGALDTSALRANAPPPPEVKQRQADQEARLDQAFDMAYRKRMASFGVQV